MAQEAAAALGRASWRVGRALVFALATGLALHPALAADPKPGPRWSELSAPQRKILAPLSGEWDRLDSASRKRWLGVAKRYPKMTPVGQKRVQTRMRKWAALTPQQREEARAKYKRMKRKNGSAELRREWQRYQALSPQEREALAAGERKRKTGAKTKRKRPRTAPESEEFSQ